MKHTPTLKKEMLAITSLTPNSENQVLTGFLCSTPTERRPPPVTSPDLSPRCQPPRSGERLQRPGGYINQHTSYSSHSRSYQRTPHLYRLTLYVYSFNSRNVPAVSPHPCQRRRQGSADLWHPTGMISRVYLLEKILELKTVICNFFMIFFIKNVSMSAWLN